MILESQLRRAGPCWRRDRVAEGDVHRAGAEGTSGRSDAWGAALVRRWALALRFMPPCPPLGLWCHSATEGFSPPCEERSQPGELLALAPVPSFHLAWPGSAEGMVLLDGLGGRVVRRQREGGRLGKGTLVPVLQFHPCLPDPTGILMHCLSLQLHSSIRGRCCAGARAGFQANWILCLRGFPCRQATGISAVFLRNRGEQG